MLQVPLVLTGLYSNAMWFVGGVFLLVWLYLLQIRKDLVGSPFGPVPDPPPPPAGLTSAVQVGQHRQHPAVVPGVGLQARACRRPC